MSAPSPLVIVGAGEHAHVVIDAARSRPDLWMLVGYCNPQPSEETTRRFSLPWLGDDDAVLAQRGADTRFVMGVGALAPSPRRQELVARYAARAARWATIVHARAIVADSASLGEGAVVLAGAVVNSGASIGAHVIVNSGAIVEHDVRVGPFAVLASACAIGGGAAIGDGAFVGLGGRVRDHVRVGARALVGMGAVVVSDVSDDVEVVGVPARSRRP